MKRDDVVVGFFSILFVFALIMLVSGIYKTGHATSQTTKSEVIISTYYSISMSSNLTTGILFGTENSTAQSNVNATGNYGGTDSNFTQYNLSVSADSNTAVNLSLSADALNTSGGDEIGLANETYANNSANSITVPALGSEVSFTTSPVFAGYNVSIGGSHYYRFWLDIPSGIAVGTYNNTVTFTGAAVS